MKRVTVVIVSFACLVVFAAACGAADSGPSVSPSPSPSSTGTTEYADAPAAVLPAKATDDASGAWSLEKPLWKFGFDLLSRQAAKTDDDVVVSPASLSAVLAMTLNGARGETATQMRAALRLGSLSEEKLNRAWADLIAATNQMEEGEARIADAIWLADGVSAEPAFLETNRDYYAAGVRNLPADLSQAPAQINGWIDKQTGGRIKELISEVTNDTALVLVNTVYVKAGWAVFDEDKTALADFTLSDGSVVAVQTMRGSLSATVVETAEYDAVKVPTSADPCLWIVVPKGDETPESVAALIRRRGPGAFERHTGLALVNLRLPRFRIEYTAEGLPEDLQAMGMTDAFSKGDADFSGMAAIRPLFISEVLQKTMIDVNEEGVEAAAASALLAKGGCPTKKTTVRADRPFLAVLTGTAGAPLFMAVVRDPR